MIMPRSYPNCIKCKKPLTAVDFESDCIDYICQDCSIKGMMPTLDEIIEEFLPEETPKLARPAFETIYMNLAIELAQRSTCARLSVGCVITSADYSHVFGIGYNGNAKGLHNGCDSEEPGNCGCLHSEENALLKVNVPSYVEKIAFVTHQPCAYCAKRFINKGGFKKIYYMRPYRLKKGLEILAEAGIETLGWTVG